MCRYALFSHALQTCLALTEKFNTALIIKLHMYIASTCFEKKD